MRKNANTKRPDNIAPYFNALATGKIATLLLLSMIVATPCFADKAKNYGDINDEDGNFATWEKPKSEGHIVKTGHKTNSSVSKSGKIVTKKISAKAIKDKRQASYGDSYQNED